MTRKKATTTKSQPETSPKHLAELAHAIVRAAGDAAARDLSAESTEDAILAVQAGAVLNRNPIVGVPVDPKDSKEQYLWLRQAESPTDRLARRAALELVTRVGGRAGPRALTQNRDSVYVQIRLLAGTSDPEPADSPKEGRPAAASG